MTALARRSLVLAAGAAFLMGAGGQAGADTALAADDMAIGRANAPITLVEYASVMCPHCREWHETVFAPLKANYIDAGKVRYVLREMAAPAQAASIVLAGFQLARCNHATPDQYMARVAILFDEQPNIYASRTMDDVRSRFVTIAMNNGMSEAQLMQCIEDPSGADRLNRISQEATRDFQVTGTPTFVLNGRKLDDPNVHTYEGLSHIIDAELARHG